ncbi:MAG: FHA domain-containing protein [Opitutaceae bacterium]|nr:FHA domain-containing protein [Verrucomicrobiales bacterium]
MVQLDVSSRTKAGTVWLARSFPFVVGRATSSDLVLDHPGVWDRHFEVTLAMPEGFLLTTQPPATLSINGQTVDSAVLRNGDVIELGDLKIRFSLQPALQSKLRAREALTWLAFVGLAAGELFLIYRLVP